MKRIDLSGVFVLLCATTGPWLAGGCSSGTGSAADAMVDHPSGDDTAATGGADATGAMGGAGGAGGTSAADVAGSGGAPSDTALDGAVDHPADTCTLPSDCPDGTCWLQLNGARACVKPPASPTLLMCPQAGDPTCCKGDGDCTLAVDGGQIDKGRCLPRTSPCGGAAPIGNSCQFDECRADADCNAGMPAGATVAICAPAGALNHVNAGCVYGGCRTDADCTRSPGGRCAYALADTGGACVVRNVLFCAYPNDPCSMTSGCSPPAMICVPNPDYQGRRCGKGLPMYP
ncbi:MAG TPA: hypothetical protein VNO55_00300 [Polyangia bacterium]|nr:hypothetical protein [Polyangia bacterium]